MFETAEFENDETVYAELACDVDSDVTISVNFRISFNANDRIVLVLIITIFKFEEFKGDETSCRTRA